MKENNSFLQSFESGDDDDPKRRDKFRLIMVARKRWVWSYLNSDQLQISTTLDFKIYQAGSTLDAQTIFVILFVNQIHGPFTVISSSHPSIDRCHFQVSRSVSLASVSFKTRIHESSLHTNQTQPITYGIDILS